MQSLQASVLVMTSQRTSYTMRHTCFEPYDPHDRQGGSKWQVAQSSFKCPVTESTSDLGAGPIARTV
jgi:hypothetical protein